MGGPLPGVTTVATAGVIAGVVARVTARVTARVVGVLIPAGFSRISLLAGITGVSSGDDSQYEKARVPLVPLVPLLTLGVLFNTVSGDDSQYQKARTAAARDAPKE